MNDKWYRKEQVNILSMWKCEFILEVYLMYEECIVTDEDKCEPFF